MKQCHIKQLRLLPLAIACLLPLLGLCAAQRADAQSPPAPATGNISYTIAASVAASNASVTLTMTARNTLPASTPSDTFTFNAATSETPPRTFAATASVPAVNNIVAGPTLSVPVQTAATATQAGLTPPAALPAGITFANGVLVWTPGNLDGGAAASASVTFRIVQPTNGASANGGASS